jgi:hypothetical protein
MDASEQGGGSMIDRGDIELWFLTGSQSLY